MIPVTSERIYPPEAFILVSELEQAVLGIVALSAMRTLQVSAPSGTPAVVLLGYREGVSATAWNQIHSQGFARVGWVLGGGLLGSVSPHLESKAPRRKRRQAVTGNALEH